MSLTGALALGLACGRSDPAAELTSRLSALLNELVAAHGFERGVALHVDSPSLGLAWEAAAGLADPTTGAPMTPAHPVRIASNTKTYVAVAVLRLVEDGRLELDDSIGGLLPADLLAVLETGGYDPDGITVRHLLTHASGLDDHGTESYAAQILGDPQHRWSRLEQLRLCVEDGRPRGAPGEVYHYSDTGYVLLGEILERTTGRNLAAAVWELVDRPGLGLDATWFETLEPAPAGVPPRAHQFYREVDVTGFDPSFDLWGGGGVVATVGDMARFTRALFAGRVFRHPATLETMLARPTGLRPPSDADDGALPPGAYGMGIWTLEHDGLELYRHTGFWGTTATWIPELDLVVTATVNQHEAGELREALVEGTIGLVSGHATARHDQIGANVAGPG